MMRFPKAAQPFFVCQLPNTTNLLLEYMPISLSTCHSLNMKHDIVYMPQKLLKLYINPLISVLSMFVVRYDLTYFTKLQISE